MKLLVISDYYMYESNGIYYFESKEKYDFFHRYLRVFEELKLATRCIHEDAVPARRVLMDDARIEYVPLPDFHGPFEYLLSYLRMERKLRSITYGCNAALLQLPCTVAMHASKYIMKAGLPYATEVVYDAEDGWKSETSLIKRLLWKRIDKNMRHICSRADGVACVTEKYLQQHYYSVKQNAFTANYSSLALDKSFYSSNRRYPDKRVLTIAHTANKIFYNWRKGHHETIEAIGLLKQEGIIVNVRFAGAIVDDSPERLKEFAASLGVQNQVEFVGFLDRQELDSFLTNADLFVLPTKAEGLPRVLIEAMAKGLPCVTTKVSGNSELISNDYLVDYSDVVGLSKKIKALVTNKLLYEEASKANFENGLKYEASLLQSRRDAYYSNLKDRIK